MTDAVIERAEVVALLFNVSDIVSALERIERLLEEGDGEEEASRRFGERGRGDARLGQR